MTIEQQIEELRAELQACVDEPERAQIRTELQAAQALMRNLDRTFDDATAA